MLSGSEETDSSYMHIFPDQYTWFFDRDAYRKHKRQRNTIMIIVILRQMDTE